MISRSPARPAVRDWSAVPALLCALGLSACGGFDSAASGEHLIKDYVKKFGKGKVVVKSVELSRRRSSRRSAGATTARSC